jgi:hypothetical protein
MFFLKRRSTNDKLATKYNKGIADAIASNFAHFGTQKETSLALENLCFRETEQPVRTLQVRPKEEVVPFQLMHHGDDLDQDGPCSY